MLVLYVGRKRIRLCFIDSEVYQCHGVLLGQFMSQFRGAIHYSADDELSHYLGDEEAVKDARSS